MIEAPQCGKAGAGRARWLHKFPAATGASADAAADCISAPFLLIRRKIESGTVVVRSLVPLRRKWVTQSDESTEQAIPSTKGELMIHTLIPMRKMKLPC